MCNTFLIEKASHNFAFVRFVICIAKTEYFHLVILSDQFLEEIKGLKQKNLAVELLRRLLTVKVKAVACCNFVRSKKFL